MNGTGKPVWTPEMDEDLKILTAKKLSARKIAELLSEKHGTWLTRNAVLGRRFRLDPPSQPKEKPTVDLFGKSLDELGEKDCRYPIMGETAPYRFCGKPKRTGSSYCACHHSVAWKPAEKPKPSTATVFRVGRPRQVSGRAA
jgi:GcrA cell cycle regulator